MQSPPKPQFASWLIEQVATGQYAGLCYVEQNKFRVPWKHNSRKDCNDEDNKIFRAWAVASGKIHEFPTDKARWKTNFRCALNNLQNRFKMIGDNSKNPEDPHKIYEIINTDYNYESPPTQHSQDDSDMTPEIFSSPVENFPSGHENLLNDFLALDLGTHIPVGQLWTGNYVGQDPVPIESYPAAAENLPQLLPETQPCYIEDPPQIHDSFQTPPPTNKLEISIHYRKREMLKRTLLASRIQLHYHQEVPELNTQHICFPSTEDLLDHKQVEYTNRILNSIERGLILEVHDDGIYAGRQDRCHVFASTSDPNVAHPNPQKLPQNTMVKILDFEKFVNEVKQFKENNGGSPEYVINMCFGEKFPDGKPLEKKLIVVKVVPVICRYVHEMAQMEGASSLHSGNVSLQISYNSLFDLITSMFPPPAAEDQQLPTETFLNQF